MDADPPKKPSASLRTLILMLNLANTRVGLTQSRLLDIVPGYVGNPGAVTRTFERDIEGLREAGFTIEVVGDDPPRYRIDHSSFSSTDLHVTSEQVDLIIKGASAWERGSGAFVHSIINKVAGCADLPVGKWVPQASYNLEAGTNLQSLLTAINDDQPIEFDYASRKAVETREVAPLRLIARRQALYLWGLDLNRWDERLFRLTRFRSDVRPLGEPGSVSAADHLTGGFDEDRFLVEPVLAVSKDEAPGAWAASKPFPTRQLESLPVSVQDLPDGFELRLGRRDDIAFWEAQLLREARGVVALAPDLLVYGVRGLLERAAKWGEDVG